MKELLIIKTAEAEKIKSLLDKGGADYQLIYGDILYDKGLKEEEVWRRDLRLANQDQQRNKEIAEWDAISDEDDWEEIKKDEWK